MFRNWIGVDDGEISFEENSWRIPLNMHHGSNSRLDMSYDVAHLIVIF